MSKHRERRWIVGHHEIIDKIDDNLWTIYGDVPGVPIKRRMAIVRRSDGSLLFYHALPMREEVLEEILDWGKPAILVIGHDNHGIDAQAFRTKLGVKTYGPKKNIDKMRKKFDVDGTIEEIPSDPMVRVESVAGTKAGEPVVIVRSGGGTRTNLVFCDAFQNNASKDLILPLRLLGFGGGPSCPPLFRLLFVDDKRALRADFERWAAMPELAHLVPCHGAIVYKDAPQILRSIAARI